MKTKLTPAALEYALHFGRCRILMGCEECQRLLAAVEAERLVSETDKKS